jgi:hypothetical protein
VTERAEQIAETVKMVLGLLGDRPASEVEVSVSRGGTYTIKAKTGDGAAAKTVWTTGRKK